MDKKEEFIGYCNSFIQYANILEGMDQSITNLITLKNEMQFSDLVVPIVGLFSAGKSTMINSLLGENYLPTAITPETSLAMELHYSNEQYIEAIDSQGNTKKYQLNEIQDLAKEAHQWAFARAYINNNQLKEIEPLVLVDMPGFDSPLDAHNKAIMTYLLKGCHYFVLNSAESGTLSNSLLLRLQEIASYNKRFSLFISKADLLPTSELNEIIEHNKSLLEDEFDFNIPISTINNNSVNDVMVAIRSLNTEELFTNLYKQPLYTFGSNILENLNMVISSLKNEKGKLEEAIKELQLSIKKINNNAEQDINNIKQKYSSSMIDSIIRELGNKLSMSTNEFINVALQGNKEAIEASFSEVIRSTLTHSIKEKFGELNVKITEDFSYSIQGLDSIMKKLDFDHSFVDTLSKQIQTAYTSISDVLNTKSNDNKTKLMTITNAALSSTIAQKITSKTIIGASGGILASLSGIIGPIIGIVIAFLPDILGSIFENIRKNQVETELRAKFEGEVYPIIKRKIREELSNKLDENISIMIQGINEKYTAILSEKKELIEASIAEQNQSKEKQDQKIAELETTRQEVMKILTTLIA